jgi:hypothetical protein
MNRGLRSRDVSDVVAALIELNRELLAHVEDLSDDVMELQTAVAAMMPPVDGFGADGLRAESQQAVRQSRRLIEEAGSLKSRAQALRETADELVQRQPRNSSAGRDSYSAR